MTTATRAPQRISPVFLAIAGCAAAAGWALWADAPPAAGLWVFLCVVACWVVSLCLHEYAHARGALHGGDASVVEKGYLTLNPLRYSHALLSVVLPVLFVIAGGIGLPGGAVFVERHRIRGRLRHSLVSVAGPLVNAGLAVALGAPFWLGAVDGVPVAFRCALAFLVLLQVTAAVLNLLPVPGLDGYGVLEPWLSEGVRRQVAPFAPFGLLAVFGCLWVPELNGFFWDGVHTLTGALGVPEADVSRGLALFRFWEGEPVLPAVSAP
ncbi:site-2 protease family protein [Streptomyces sp. TRM 70351]|uniref:site-2 protease family protein n=1 Tax=Streptomyces sp. TRM 70351 TaxID=3116552 RepID=UPI002E7ACBB8|nr:site-2 protease family protein [Streptomyces sp. TRM 70351]MEE1928595.1 site-2 protease family protein [Streptomyces sp. TRM 70351]